MLLHLGLQQELHWLPTKQPIIFKILLMTFKCLNGIAPSYLSDLVTRYIPWRNLRFANGHRLFDVKYNLRNNGFRSFSVVSPQLWNDMPLGIRSCASLNDFKKKVKTNLFRKAFWNCSFSILVVFIYISPLIFQFYILSFC